MSTVSFQSLSGYDEIEKELPDVGMLTFPDFFGTESQELVLLRAGLCPGLFDGIFRKSFQPLPAPTPSTPVQISVRDVFKSTQSGLHGSFNSHPAVTMMVNFMKSSITMEWDGKPVRTTIFPGFNPGIAPPSLSVAGLDESKFRDSANALLVKAFYNRCPNRQGSIDIEKANSGVQSINDHINAQATPMIIQFYRTLFSLSPSSELVDKYKALLLSPPYRKMKQQQASLGHWPDPNLEMFCHFSKLAACGASDDDIREVYEQLTSTVPMLSGGTFGEIQPDSWRNYRGWLSSGYLDWGDLEAQRLDAYCYSTAALGTMGNFPVPVDLVEIFTFRNGYKKSPVSSCLGSDTRVIMNTSGKTRRIDEIQPGDRVLTAATSKLGSAISRTVAFVSSPGLQGRTLYSMKDYPGIRFTSTHPILVRNSAEQSTDSQSLRLSFVDKDLASSSNPSWQSFVTDNIPSDQLVSYDSDPSTNELVYDLVFEPLQDSPKKGKALATYILEADNGARLTVGSESPILEWYPLELSFFTHAVHRLLSHPQQLQPALALLNTAHASVRGLLRAAAADLASSRLSIPKRLNVIEPPNLLHACASSQKLADVVEQLIIFLGRALSNELKTGWARGATKNQDAPSATVLIVYLLRQLDGDYCGCPPDVGAMQHLKIWDEDTLVFDAQVTGTVQGQSTVQLYFPVILDGAPRDGDVCNITVQSTDLASQLTWYGRGPVAMGVESQLGMGNIADGPVDHHAVVELEVREVPQGVLGRHTKWDEEQAALYAQRLGMAFGEKLLAPAKSVQGV